MFPSSIEEIVARFTIRSNFAVITRVSINKKGEDLFIKVYLNQNKVFNLRLDRKTTFKLQKRTVLLALLTKGDLNYFDFYRGMEEHRLTAF